MTRVRLSASALALALVLGSPVEPASPRAQEVPADDLRREIESLREILKEMQRDLQDIKDNMPRRGLRDPVNALVDVSRHRFRGERTAPLTLVEFSDYQCPFCARHVRETSPSIEAEYVRTGRLKSVFVDLPLERQHPLAFKAAEAAACAGEGQKYWEMHDRLFAGQGQLEPWSAHAAALGLDVPAFEECLASGRHAASIRRGASEASRLAIGSTPYFLVGRTERDGSSVRVVATLQGARPFAAFKEILDRLLAQNLTPSGPAATQ
jgi:protein-disulfide isomerase